MNHKLPGAQFDVTASKEHRSVFLNIADIEGNTYLIPLNIAVATELGKQILAGVLAVGGSLV